MKRVTKMSHHNKSNKLQRIKLFNNSLNNSNSSSKTIKEDNNLIREIRNRDKGRDKDKENLKIFSLEVKQSN